MKESKYKLSQEALNYKPQPISAQHCNKVLVEMILNNMKIEGQEVPKNDYLEFRAKMREKKLNEDG